MYAFLNKYGQALAFGIGVLVTVIFMMSIFGASESEMTAVMSETAGPEKYETSAFDFGIMGAIVLTVIAFIVALVFGIAQFASNPKGSIKGLIGLVALIAIAFIAYSSANGTISEEPAAIVNSINKFETDQETTFSEGTLKFVSGSIITSLILIGLAIASLVVFGIRGIFK